AGVSPAGGLASAPRRALVRSSVDTSVSPLVGLVETPHLRVAVTVSRRYDNFKHLYDTARRVSRQCHTHLVDHRTSVRSNRRSIWEGDEMAMSVAGTTGIVVKFRSRAMSPPRVPGMAQRRTVRLSARVPPRVVGRSGGVRLTRRGRVV